MMLPIVDAVAQAINQKDERPNMENQNNEEVIKQEEEYLDVFIMSWVFFFKSGFQTFL